MNTKIDPSIQSLVEKLKNAMQRLNVLRFDEDDPSELGLPCNETQISTVRTDLGMPLPPSYEEFLRLHNGWTEFLGEAPLLSAEDRSSSWYFSRVQGIREHLNSFGDPDFLLNGFLILVHPDVSSLLYLDKGRPTAEGELEVVYYSLRDGEYERYPSFKGFLESWLLSLKKEIAEEES
jgi:hypothetical protein